MSHMCSDTTVIATGVAIHGPDGSNRLLCDVVRYQGIPRRVTRPEMELGLPLLSVSNPLREALVVCQPVA